MSDDAPKTVAELQAEIDRLNRINTVLMDRVERSMAIQGDAFSIFQTAVALEEKARESAVALEDALGDLGRMRLQLREAIEVIDEGFAMFDAQDRLVLCNERYRSIWANAPLIGATFEQLARTLIAQNSLPQAIDDPEKWVAERIERHLNPRDPVLVQSSDGRWLQVSERRTGDGGIVSLYTDVTEIKAVEARRRERELAQKSIQLQATLDNLDQGVSVLNRTGRLESWNQRFIELLSGDAPLSELPSLADLTTVPLPYAAEYQTQAGRVLDVRVNPMPGDGRVATFTDITDRQAKEQQLVQAVDRLSQANTELERFAYVASHDLREPLRTIVSFTQLLQRRYPMEGEAQDYIDLVIGAGKRMNALICGLLDYSRVSGQASPFRPCDMQKICALVLDNLRGSIEQSGARIAVQPLPTVSGDAVQLVQLLQNLIGNGIKYCRPGVLPEVRIDANLAGNDEWCFTVTDNGIGIEDGNQDIYEIFRRLHHSSAYPGTGIGLAVCRRIVEHHGGRLWHEAAETGGTRFLFILKADTFSTPSSEPALFS
ncbi:MAG TPA: PAS-domain containing protein [Candidatus Sulfotelmatobacter sp.]|jgi:signal transduction histidine kinase|nr:PAS-domain containing protein [Candidatus Sulfotelmatobacter sp.]